MVVRKRRQGPCLGDEQNKKNGCWQEFNSDTHQFLSVWVRLGLIRKGTSQAKSTSTLRLPSNHI